MGIERYMELPASWFFYLWNIEALSPKLLNPETPKPLNPKPLNPKALSPKTARAIEAQGIHSSIDCFWRFRREGTWQQSMQLAQARG